MSPIASRADSATITAGTRHTRDAARNVNGATEPIARAAYRRSGGNADAQLREALCIRGCNQSQSGVQQRHRIGAYKHHRVPNRLDEPNGSDGDVAGKILQSAGELFQFLGRHRLTKAGESDEVSECHRNLTCTGQCACGSFSGIDCLRFQRMPELKAKQVLDHRSEQR